MPSTDIVTHSCLQTCMYTHIHIIYNTHIHIQWHHVISTSSHDALIISCLLLVGKSAHVPGHPSGGSHSEWDARAAAQVATLL